MNNRIKAGRSNDLCDTDHVGIGSAPMPWWHTGARAGLSSNLCSVAVLAIGGTNGGTLDSLLMEGSVDLTVIEESSVQLEHTKRRLGPLAKYIAWKHGHVLDADLSHQAYDVWFDQTWFRKLANESERRRYMDQVRRALRPGGTAYIDGRVIQQASV